MKRVFDLVVALSLGLFAALARAVEEAAATLPEATVSVVWVAVFMVIFVGVCAWIGIAIWRNERQNRGKSQEGTRP